MDYDGCQTAILKDNDCGDMTIIQDYGEGTQVMFLDTNEVQALKAILI
jgi:hypothetical protein